MNIEELNSIILKGENSRTEFKESGEMVTVGFYQTVVSLLNHEGGVILLGVDDNGMEKGSSWTEKGAKLKNARINRINKLQFNDFEKGSSWEEKGVKLLPKRTLAILKVLIICLVPVKIEEIRQILTFGSRNKLRELYLNPLRKEGMIEITIRDKPNSPEQKYVTTEKGRLFLGGFEII